MHVALHALVLVLLDDGKISCEKHKASALAGPKSVTPVWQ